MESQNNQYITPNSDLEHAPLIEKKSHSKLGIASFITSILAGIIMLALFIYAGILETNTPGGMSEDSIEAMLIGFGIISIGFMLLVSLGLGIAGLFQKQQQKVFATIGTVFSSIIIFGTIALLIIGITME